MSREQKRAGDVEVGARIYFPNSRRPVTVGQVLNKNGAIHLIADDESAKWMMTADTIISVEVEDEDA